MAYRDSMTLFLFTSVGCDHIDTVGQASTGRHWRGHKTWRNRWRDVIGIGGSKKLSTGLTGLTGQFIGKTSNPHRGIGGILAFFMEE